MQKMCVNMADVVRQLGRQHQCLAEAADAVRGRIAFQVGEPGSQRRGVSGQSARLQPAAPNPGQFPMQVFGKIEQRRTDLAMDRMDRAVRGMTQRNDQDVEPEALQSQNLLSDEGFRKPRIPFEDKGDASCCRWRCRHTQVP